MKPPSVEETIFPDFDTFGSMEQHSVEYKNSTINYYRFGSGAKLLFAFHGYGEDGLSFRILESSLGKEYTIIAPDLPFHGITEWREGLDFTVNELLDLLVLCGRPISEPMSLLGYSMGGRIALQLLQTIPGSIKKIVLIAPDGLHHNFWHSFATQTWLGSKLFSYTMHHTGWLLVLMRLATRLRLFNKNLINFVHYYLDDVSSRLILYRRWTTLRKFNTSIGLLKKIIRENHIPITLLFGRYDPIILTKRGLNFQKGIKEFVTVKELEAGHQILKEKYSQEITAMFTA